MWSKTARSFQHIKMTSALKISSITLKNISEAKQMNNELNELLPFLIPLILLQLLLMITALVMAIRQQTFKYLNKPVWVLIILFNLIGPILYFVLERR